MAQPVKTPALAAYVDSKKLRFAGAPLTLPRLAQMLAIPPTAIAGPTVDDAALAHFARYLKLSVDELSAAAATQKVAPSPGVPAAPIPKSGSDTTVMPRPQLADLVAKSRPSEPVITPPAPAPAASTPPPLPPPPAPAATPAPPPASATEADVDSVDAEDDADVTITFDDVEATPVPTSATDAKSDTKSGKSSKSKSKKR